MQETAWAFCTGSGAGNGVSIRHGKQYTYSVWEMVQETVWALGTRKVVVIGCKI